MGKSSHPEGLRSRPGRRGQRCFWHPNFAVGPTSSRTRTSWPAAPGALLCSDTWPNLPQAPSMFALFSLDSALWAAWKFKGKTHLEQTHLPLAFYLSLEIQPSLFLPLSKIPTREAEVGRKDGEKMKKNPSWYGQTLKISSVAKR